MSWAMPRYGSRQSTRAGGKSGSESRCHGCRPRVRKLLAGTSTGTIGGAVRGLFHKRTLARFLPGSVDLLPPVASPGAAADAPPPIAQARSKRRPREPWVRFALA
jgi:hypothetical protein